MSRSIFDQCTSVDKVVIWFVCATRNSNLELTLKVSKNRNDFMKTSFLPKTNKIIVRISAHYTIGQKS